MEIHVAEKITIKSPVPAIRNYCRNKLILDNPDFYKKERMGKWTGNTPKTINLYEQIGGNLVLPFGCLQDIWQLYPHKDAWGVEFCPIRHFDYQSRINLYPYQYNAVMAALGRKNGILVMPCVLQPSLLPKIKTRSRTGARHSAKCETFSKRNPQQAKQGRHGNEDPYCQ